MQLVPLPILGYHYSTFYALISFALALVFVLVYLDTKYTVVSTFIGEKETRMREVLKIQGISTLEFVCSWYISYAIQFALLNAVIAVCSGFPDVPTDSGEPLGGTFSKSSLSVLFVFYWLYSMAFVAKGLTISLFFDKSRTGGMIACIVFLRFAASSTHWLATCLTLCVLAAAGFFK